MARFEPEGRAGAASVALLLTEALPGEPLTADELAACLWDDPDPSVVLTCDGAVVAAVVRATGAGPVGFIRLLAVQPAEQGRGLGRAAVGAAEAWAADHGCQRVHTGAEAPFYLWPGVDTRWARALSLFERLGYRREGAEMNLSCPSTVRHPAPPGTRVGRVLDDAEADAVLALCRRQFPHWEAEAERSIEQATCHGAWAGSDLAGFACHSVNRRGWLGPMATDPRRRGTGVGGALVGAVCADVAALGLPDVEIAWVGPVGFYARAAGAGVSRVFIRYASTLGSGGSRPA